MRRAQFEEMYNLEETYWWFVGQRRLVAALASRYASRPCPRILDVGCGTGGALAGLHTQGTTCGCDLSGIALGLAQQRGLTNLAASRAESLAFRPDSVDVVLSCDVLEHVPRDDLALGEMRRVLTPGGVLIATVPAYPRLWSSHDDVLGHVRRYQRRPLRQAVTAAGFEIVKLTYAVTLALPPIAVLRSMGKLRRKKPDVSAGVGLIILPQPLNQLLVRGLDLERWLILRGRYLPWGCSLVVVARKPGRP